MRVASSELSSLDTRTKLILQALIADINRKKGSSLIEGIFTLEDVGASLDESLTVSYELVPHAETHESGGTDEIALDELGAPSDSTLLDATTTAHGLLPKLDGSTGRYLAGDGKWREPPPLILKPQVNFPDDLNFLLTLAGDTNGF